MSFFMQMLVPFAVFLVGIILIAGLWNMMRGGDPSRSQKLMRGRVLLQFTAIIIIMSALFFMGR